MRVFYVLLGAMLALGVALPGPVQASLTNPSFEHLNKDGDPDGQGWTANFPGSGSVLIKDSHFSVSPGPPSPFYDGSKYTAPDGKYFVEIKSDGSDWPQFILQEAFLNKGETIIGWAAFDGGDIVRNDWAAVDIFTGKKYSDLQSNPNYNVGGDRRWYHDILSPPTVGVGPFGNTPWEKWSFTALADDYYTIVFRVNNTKERDRCMVRPSFPLPIAPARPGPPASTAASTPHNRPTPADTSLAPRPGHLPSTASAGIPSQTLPGTPPPW